MIFSSNLDYKQLRAIGAVWFVLDEVKRALKNDMTLGAFQAVGMIGMIEDFDVGAGNVFFAGITCHGFVARDVIGTIEFVSLLQLSF